jgi:AraC-like DNA-binding protein
MSEKVTYIKWRSRLEEITPADHRIGTDILLIDNTEMMADSSLEYEPFKVDMTMAIIYEQGSAELMVNMKKFHVQAPAVLIVMNDQIYQPLGHSDDLRSKVILMSRAFSDNLFINSGDIMPLQSVILKNPVMEMANEENVFGQFYQLLLNVTSSPHAEYKIEVARHLTLSMFYGYSSHKHQVMEAKTASTRQEEIYEDFISLLEKHYRTEREIGFYADRLCITPKYLSSTLKELTGRTALELIEEYAISECKALLLSTRMTIQQISDELNFPSQSVFGKYFKRVTGMSPKEYRKIRNA